MKKAPAVGKRILKGLVELFQMLLITFFIVLLVFTYIFRIVSVVGDSMDATLHDGDKVVIDLLYSHPEPGDIVVARTDKCVLLNSDGSPVESEGINMSVIKRVIAVGGQKLDIDFAAGVVYIDGKRLREPYLKYGLTHRDEGAFTGQYPIIIPEGCVFVMGDNRSVSKDSRSVDVGLIPEESITGKVILRFYPDFSLNV